MFLFHIYMIWLFSAADNDPRRVTVDQNITVVEHSTKNNELKDAKMLLQVQLLGALVSFFMILNCIYHVCLCIVHYIL